MNRSSKSSSLIPSRRMRSASADCFAIDTGKLPNTLMRSRSSCSSVDIPAVADVNDQHEQFLLMHDVEDAIASDSIGVPALQLALERFALMGVTLQIIEGAGHSLVERRFPLDHAANDALGLVGEFDLIGGQGRL